jgi:hypothetical protein
MDFIKLRVRFRQASGRFDLVGSDGSDTGAGELINTAIRFLEDRVRTPNRKAAHPFLMSVGTMRVAMPYCRTVDMVYITDDTGTKELEQVTLREFRELYPPRVAAISSSVTPPLANKDASGGLPKYYTIANLRLAPGAEPTIEEMMQDPDLMDGLVDLEDVIVGDETFWTGILISPPTDAAYTIKIYGDFYNPPLVEDSDRNWWTTHYPELIVNTARYFAEGRFRNTEGVNDWLAFNSETIRGIRTSTIELEMPADPHKEMSLGL